MNVLKVLSILTIFLLMSCGDKNDYRWEIETTPEIKDIEVIDVSKSYYDPNISNDELKNLFPDFFGEASDSLLTDKRNDSINLAFNQMVKKAFADPAALKDSLADIFARLKHFYPNFEVPRVHTFTGEMPYEYPVAYFPQSQDMVIGLDWFLGQNNPLYEEMRIQEYFKVQMNPENFKPEVVESMARQMVPYDIRKRKFIEKMIYEGKVLIIQDALLPNTSDAAKIGYSEEDLAWAYDNAAQVYLYFTEEQIFFSDDKKLNERFLEPAPFSKFFSENDTKSPGKIGAWMGWQICRSYLDKNKDIDLRTFLMDQDLLKIFKESGYKPVD